MQLYAAKRKGDFLMTVGYTWSQALTDASGFNDNPRTRSTGISVTALQPLIDATFSSRPILTKSALFAT